jgi:diguanylate cyclase (GGDEF)-like protein
VPNPKRQSVIEVLLSVNRSSSGMPVDKLVPFFEHSVHVALCLEVLRIANERNLSELSFLVDSHSAEELPELITLAEQGAQVVVLGKSPSAPPPRITYHSVKGGIPKTDHFFVMRSGQAHAIILGMAADPKHDDEVLFQGIWSVDGQYVRHAIQTLPGGDLLSSPTSEESEKPDFSMDTQLMGCHAHALSSLKYSMVRDKHDLFSVLHILKAISSERRAHDILYVFVEQIARVVCSERCSVVRIWGEEDRGSVLASHEDQSVSDQAIELSKYPEIQQTLRTGNKVVINDVSLHPMTKALKEVWSKTGIQSLLVIPIVLGDENVGSLVLRAARHAGTFSEREIGFFEIVTEAASNALERAQLFETIQAANRRLEQLAITDGLTNLYNIRFFRERMDEELQRAQRYDLPLTCMIMDVDNFKTFNDTYGHLSGDMVLREIARRTLECVRRNDVLARYGGEEFVVLMPQTDLNGGLVEADRIRESICQTPFEVEGGEVNVTISAGVGYYDHEKMKSSEDLLRQADQGLYAAKGAGKNCVIGPEEIRLAEEQSCDDTESA